MTSVEFVEKALIGSLLNDSTRRPDVPWLRAEDFTNPLCLAIWRHLESGNPPHCQRLTDLVDLSEALGRDYELHPRLRSPAELATLQFQAPEKPAVVEYGRILVEATIRREVAAMGLRLESLMTRRTRTDHRQGRGRADIPRRAGPTPQDQPGPAERRRHRSHCWGSVRLR